MRAAARLRRGAGSVARTLPCAAGAGDQARRVPGSAGRPGRSLQAKPLARAPRASAASLAGRCWTTEARACCGSQTHSTRARPGAPDSHGSSDQALEGAGRRWGRAFWAGVSWPALISSSTMWCSYCARASAAAVRPEAWTGRSTLPGHARGAGKRAGRAAPAASVAATGRARHTAPSARGAPRLGPGRASGYG